MRNLSKLDFLITLSIVMALFFATIYGINSVNEKRLSQKKSVQIQSLNGQEYIFTVGLESR